MSKEVSFARDFILDDGVCLAVWVVPTAPQIQSKLQRARKSNANYLTNDQPSAISLIFTTNNFTLSTPNH